MNKPSENSFTLRPTVTLELPLAPSTQILHPEQVIVKIGSVYHDIGAICYALRSDKQRRPGQAQEIVLSSFLPQRPKQVVQIIDTLSSEMTEAGARPATIGSHADNLKVFVDWADTTRWKVINKSLGLPFSEIPETYSTSEHLHTDHDIPKGTKGRLKPPAPREPKEPRDSHGEHGHHARTERPREQRPPRDRSRRRLRNGEPVDSLDSTSAVATASAEETPEAVAATATAEAAAEAPARRRRRRRPAASTD